MASRGAGRAYFRYRITRSSVRKGLFGGSRFWLAVFAALRLGRFGGKVTKRGEAPVVFSEKLRPGESYEIRHIGPD